MTATQNIIIKKSSLQTEISLTQEALKFADRALKEGGILMLQSAYLNICRLLKSKSYNKESEDNLYCVLNDLFVEIKAFGSEAVQGMLAC